MPTEQEKLLAKQIDSQRSQDALRSLMGIDRLKKGFTHLEQGASQAIPNNAYQAIGWDTEVEDGLECFDAAVDNTRIVPPTDGWLEILFMASWNNNASGTRYLSIWKNSVKLYEVAWFASAQDPAARGFIPARVHALTNDYLEAVVLQVSGGGSLGFGPNAAGVHTPSLSVQRI